MDMYNSNYKINQLAFWQILKMTKIIFFTSLKFNKVDL